MEPRLDEPQYLQDVKYKSAPEATRLHTLDIYFQAGYTPTSKKLWIIYIHGGAWRDPAIDSSSFSPTRQLLLSESRISALASINYRLSPCPSNHESPSSPDDPARNAQHPDHLEDICCALTYLQEQYHIGSHYVLVGHSCGATLAFQALLEPEATFQKPHAVLGVEGIYDLVALRNHFQDIPIYQEFLTGAFGNDEEVWKKASPVNGRYDQVWKEGKVACVAHSKEDSMVDQSQALNMMLALQKSEPNSKRHNEIFWIEGEHDEIWQKADALAKSIIHVLDELAALELR